MFSSLYFTDGITCILSKCSDLVVDKRHTNHFLNLRIYTSIPEKTLLICDCKKKKNPKKSKKL